ncbi:hypothetical protein ASPWEDRAFT_178646 [Aspergillus wentii DTO 134E9]|uniref:Uncharacterized protein n=1 Tax=Aspergillus wentii DTO 134E9 TaxID=1073089 RepID=A0A1L9S0Y2_ASPWE|nr:uncharacterized protein ASPWEDRAFT_178646 [Aspergillus wentii DTO 134E9]KAI9931173.1 hypothetical protein MW887_010832 [Aspergillus wentii]OJJ40820.1 hypothetical protein ASPWEDRAFT_178646 [Aspergillus wentii DTO 134E9]
MANLSNSAIIVIVIVCCLAVVCIGAALFRQYSPAEHDTPSAYQPQHDQQHYMRSVRMRNFGFLQGESVRPKDVESHYAHTESSAY